jgi:pimeloyl-ACP methyl ester carboxylesterase
MPMSPVGAAFLMAIAGCVPKYAQLSPMEPDGLKTPFPTRTIDVKGVAVAYVDEGAATEQPPLIFVHGLSSYLGYWEHQLPHFARDRRVLALDLPGYGASGRPDAPYTPVWYSELIVDWMDQLQIDKAILIGHSMGGQISMTVALNHPERVERLVLAAPAGIERFDAGAARWMKEYWTEDRALEATEAELRATFTTLVFNRHDDGVERLLEERVRMSRTRAFQGTSVAVARSVAGMLDHPVWPRLGQIEAPTLIVYGTDDRMIPNPVFTGGSTRAIAEAGQRAIPHSELVLIPGAGHTVQHDAPDDFNRAVEEFLQNRTRP